MHMKKILCLFVLVSVASCDSFTSLNPVSNRTASEFYDSPEEFRTAVNGAYNSLTLSGTYNRVYWMLFEMRSDNTDQGGDVTGLAADLAALNEFDELTTSAFVQNAWTASYKGVQRCNIILSRIGDVEMDQTLKNQFIGEALFLRSLFYYNIAVAWGNVPLILEETLYPDIPAINQVPAEEVYAQIIDDLKRAAELLPKSYPPEQVGRATSGAALTLLGKVYLTVGQDQNAERVLRRVVQDYDYRLLEDYGKLWGVDRIENSAESIFEVQFEAGGVGIGNRFTEDFQAENRPNPDLINAYEPGDPRKDISLTADSMIAKYVGQQFAPRDAGNNFIVLRYADVLLMLAEAIGESPEAYGLINQVRNRVGLPDIGPSTPGTFKELLLHERRVELAFENHRWPTLRRFGMIEVVLDEQNVDHVNPLFPIPQTEIDVAPDVMEQNPAYR